jgi:hypothetical protein
VSLVEHELLTLPKPVSSSPNLSGIRVNRSLVLYIYICKCLRQVEHIGGHV